jgi:hypothetical protein
LEECPPQAKVDWVPPGDMYEALPISSEPSFILTKSLKLPRRYNKPSHPQGTGKVPFIPGEK